MDLSEEPLHRRFQRHVLLILRKAGIVPICSGKDGTLLILLQRALDQRIQNRLLILKMAVERRLADPHGLGQLRDGGCLIALHREQLQRSVQDLPFGVSFCRHLLNLLSFMFSYRVTTER